MNNEVLSAVISAGTTVLTGVVGFCVVIWQVRKQAENAIQAGLKSEADKLKLDIYKNEVIPVEENITNFIAEMKDLVTIFLEDVHGDNDLNCSSIYKNVPSLRMQELSKQFDLRREVIKIVSFTERWFVIDPRFKVFTTAMCAALYDVGKYYDEYNELMFSGYCPVEVRGEVKWSPLSEEQIKKLKDVSENLLSALYTVMAFTSDFRREMENILIGPLFENEVPQRESSDKNDICITLDKSTDLIAYFENETEWGRKQKR